jgi:RimJ/RimL family protein N-acetyltransferase
MTEHKEPMPLDAVRAPTGGTSLIGFVAEGWVDLLRAGLVADTVPLIYWDDRAVVAYDAGRPIGIITYAKADWLQCANIHLGYVVPEHRGHGVYRALWEALVAKCRELKLREINGSTHVDNTAMRSVAARLGRVEHSINLVFKL